MLEEKTKAPEFSTKDQNNTEHQLSDYAGKWVLLYFYPKDDTPGCTTEACGIRDAFSEIEKRVSILGVSADSIASHRAFAEKYHLQFPLLADEDKAIIKAYGADGFPFAKRISYLINPEGIIAKVYPKVDPSKHAEQIIKDVDTLKG